MLVSNIILIFDKLYESLTIYMIMACLILPFHVSDFTTKKNFPIFSHVEFCQLCF